MPKLRLISVSMLLLALAAVLAWLGVSVPVHFRAVSPALVARAGAGTTTVHSLANDYTLSGDVGPVRLLWEADPGLPASEVERDRVRDILQRKPLYWHSGGPAPYYEAFLERLNPPTGSQNEKNVVELLVSSQARSILADYLSGSANLTVQQLLELRKATGWTRFMPVSSAAGHPLDASLLTLALLVQSDDVTPDLRHEIQDLSERTLAGDRSAQDSLEDLLLGVLSIGRRMDYVQMAELFSVLENKDRVVDAAQRMVADPGHFPGVYAAALLLKDYAPVEHYLQKESGERGMEALFFALQNGAGSLEKLFAQDKPLYQAPLIVRWLDGPLAWFRKPVLLPFALAQPHLALGLKILLMLLSGYCLAAGANRLLVMAGGLPAPRRGFRPLLLMGNLFVALAFTFLLWMIVEPNLLQFTSERASALRLEFGPGAPLESLTSQSMNPNKLDQVTILVLLLFAFVQGIVYVFGLLKLKEIRRQNVPARTKLRLLENEDNLFDLGLYVGLGGTVASLILLAMDIVQASLIAAYASTMFGIIFTAVLKILNVRPYRRGLIIKAEEASNATRAPIATTEG